MPIISSKAGFWASTREIIGLEAHIIGSGRIRRYVLIITAIQGYPRGYYWTENKHLTNTIMDVGRWHIGLPFADNNIPGGAESTILAIFENNHVRTLQLYETNCIFR